MRNIVLLGLCLILLLPGPVAAAHPAQRQDMGYVMCVDEPEAPICEVEPVWNVDRVRMRLAGKTGTLWRVKDELYFAYMGKADSVYLDGGLQTPLRPLTRDNNVWGVALRVSQASQAVIAYSFVPVRDGVPDYTGSDYTVWRGPAAPPRPPYHENLHGTLQTHRLDFLDDKREVSVYLPPDHDPSVTLPVLYMADGQMLQSAARYVEPLIEDGTLPPLVIVGVHAAGISQGEDMRAAEYLIARGHERFAIHEQFFMDDLMAWAEETFGVSAVREDRAVFGFSNGASFAIAMGLRHPDQIGSVIAFSVAWLPFDIPAMSQTPRGRYYLEGGTLEPAFHDQTLGWADHLTELGMTVVFTERVGGHDAAIWNAELPNALDWVFNR